MALLKECNGSHVRLVYKHDIPTGVCAQHGSQHRASINRLERIRHERNNSRHIRT